MKRRGNATTWLLGILIAILGGIGIDIGHKMSVGEKPKNPEAVQWKPQPSFRVGDRAPNFTLPDDRGRMRTLTELVKGKDTILTFSCGCAACRAMHTYIAELVQKMGADAPQVVTVTSMPPEGEAAWIRDTKLKQTFLFQPHEGRETDLVKRKLKGGNVIDVFDLYKGHPCPRVYRVNQKGLVAFIGLSSTEIPKATTIEPMAYDVAKGLNFSLPGDKHPGQIEAPRVGQDVIRKMADGSVQGDFPPEKAPDKTPYKSTAAGTAPANAPSPN